MTVPGVAIIGCGLIGRKRAGALPGARLVVIPQCGHVSNMEQPARFNAEVREFCRSV